MMVENKENTLHTYLKNWNKIYSTSRPGFHKNTFNVLNLGQPYTYIPFFTGIQTETSTKDVQKSMETNYHYFSGC